MGAFSAGVTAAVNRQGSRAFTVLWLGQLGSNLGTQASLYGMGLWLFQQHWRVLDFAAVALVVQGARLLALPLVGRRLPHWPPRRTMLLANALGGWVSGGLALLLLTHGNRVPVALLLPLLALSAAAEATLVLCFSALITTLVPAGAAQTRAAGLFASSDGLVLTVAPFLGAWLVSLAGLRGVLLLDGISFVAAGCAVALAPWPAAALLPPATAAGLQTPTAQSQRRQPFWRSLVPLLRHPTLAPLAWLGTALALVHAGCEVLFPAWLLAGMGPARVGPALAVGGLGYGLGVLLWTWRRPSRPLAWLRPAVALQAWVLIGAGLVVFERWQPVWWLALLLFSAALPISLAALQCLWQQRLRPEEQAPTFALRYSLEWGGRLLGLSGLALLADGLLRPALAWTFWPAWLLEGLGQGPGRPMAVALGAAGWVLLLTLLRQSGALAAPVHRI